MHDLLQTEKVVWINSKERWLTAWSSPDGDCVGVLKLLEY